MIVCCIVSYYVCIFSLRHILLMFYDYSSFYFILFFYIIVLFFFFFFFSSRRRHTRCLSDWSSDVCSSDLGFAALSHPTPRAFQPSPPRKRGSRATAPSLVLWIPAFAGMTNERRRRYRSEERRVGKEGRSRWATYRYKKNERAYERTEERNQ